MSNKKQTAEHFLMLTAKGSSKEAFFLYVAENFKHHNVFFKGDAETLIKAMEDSAKQNPDTIFEIQRSIEEDNLVAVHSYYRRNVEDSGVAVMHIFRFEENKIVELWDFGQAVPKEIIKENGMF
jgi:predicted SnoaL-like aldol condensation-catalyzing enzyme